jgi:hypothetical protein
MSVQSAGIPEPAGSYELIQLVDICRSCSVRDACGGVFTTSGNRLSRHLRPVP